MLHVTIPVQTPKFCKVLQQKVIIVNNICYNQTRLTIFQQQAETKKSLLERCSLFSSLILEINQTGWFSLLQNNSTKVLKHRTRKEYNSSCGLAFWLPCETHTWHEYHHTVIQYIKRHELLWFV